MIKYSLLIIAILLTACPSDPTSNIVIPKPFSNDDSSWCQKGCEHLSTLPGQDGKQGCLEARPLIHPINCTNDEDCTEGRCVNNSCTESCEEVCAALIKDGRFMGPQCWTTIENCEEIETKCRR